MPAGWPNSDLAQDFLQHAQETDPANSPASVENPAVPREEEVQMPMRPEDIMQRRALENRVKDIFHVQISGSGPGHEVKDSVRSGKF